MNFINTIWKFIKAAAKIVVSWTVGPLLAIVKGEAKTFTTIAINVVGQIARVVFFLSFFIAVPAWAVTASVLWFVLELVAAAALLGYVIAVTFKMVGAAKQGLGDAIVDHQAGLHAAANDDMPDAATA